MWHGQIILINHSIYDLKWKLPEIINATWYAYFTITMQSSLVFKQSDVFLGNNDVDVLKKIFWKFIAPSDRRWLHCVSTGQG